MSPRKPSSPSSRSRIETSGDVGAYLHIPFCLRKCAYCDFASVPLEQCGGPSAARGYLEALGVEIDLRAATAEFAGAPVKTVYVGGGTPTILPPEWIGALIARLKNRLPVDADAEITVEANPGTVDEQGIADLLAGGVNRLSLGVQSFCDHVLQVLGRSHSAAEGAGAIAAARAAGCANLGVDLIYGVPHQSLGDWRDTLERCVAEGPEHVSAYALSVEPDTSLADDIAADRLTAPDEDLAADMYLLGVELLESAGYRHYEISNFARPGCECEHNRRYWANAEYLGLGSSAHSYRGGIRWNNVPDPEVYIECLGRGRLPVARAEALSVRGRVGEMLMLGLRRAEGVSEAEVAARCGLGPRDVLAEAIQELCDDNLLTAEDGVLRIPRSKWLVSNELLAHFVAD
jgi:oxygen-independent coproporphyrinogen-3 oxidase